MKTEQLRARTATSAAESLPRAAALLRAGGLVAFPTETVYGLGANALDPIAIARIFEAKGRPTFDPLIVHIADRADLPLVLSPAALEDPRVTLLADALWPGPLTIVAPAATRIPIEKFITSWEIFICAGMCPPTPEITVWTSLLAGKDGLNLTEPYAKRRGAIPKSHA